ncbi:MAG: SUMF1/EgtB/PvdO family nonheme iron enzyme [Verrucomicrobiia bacterium]|jgi:formylglycine-generating enzyme required for sulfatase activity
MRELIGQRIGDYEILSEIGRGAMGVVYKARQYSLDRPAAVKVLSPLFAADEGFIERFKREGMIMASITHTNIVSVYEAGSHLNLETGERLHYFAMEYVEGESVQSRLKRQGRITPDEAVAIAVHVAQGLECAWNKARLIHRDIKPSNIFLSSQGDVKLGDLGLARCAGDMQAGKSLTETGGMIGTAYYMSPEQARGERDIDFRSDIYSLGCTLYRMLCDRHVYEGAFASVVVQHLTEPPPNLRMQLPDCPVELAKLIEKMLAKHPSGRHQNYDELITELRRVHKLLTQPKAAPTLRPRVKRTQTPLTYGVVALAAAAITAGVFVWAPWKAEPEASERGALSVRPAPRAAELAPKEAVPAEATKPATPAVVPMAATPQANAAVAVVASPATPDVPRPAPPAEASAKPEAKAVVVTPATIALVKAGQPLLTSIGMELVPIAEGEFMLGSTREEREWAAGMTGGRPNPMSLQGEGEEPRKTVIRQPFWLGRTEVTVGQWKQFVVATKYVTEAEKDGPCWAPSDEHTWRRVEGASWKDPHFADPPKDNEPVCCVSWNDAVAFCAWLNEREKSKGKLPAGCKFRLPTEAEWEYACRAGKQTKFWWGDAQEEGEGRLNWSRTRREQPAITPVDYRGAQGRNGFGLADMLGNVWEWCLDDFDTKGAHEELWTGHDSLRVIRGGAFGGGPGLPRCAFRESRQAGESAANCGFRVCCGVAR